MAQVTRPLRSRAAGFWPVFDPGLSPILRPAGASLAATLSLLVVSWFALPAAGGGMRALLTLLATASVGAIVALASAAAAARAAFARTLDDATNTLDALATGDGPLPFRESDDLHRAALAAAIGRLARQLRDNGETARLLAAGAFRRAARPVSAQDPMGLALAQVARSMEEVALAAQRVARGDVALAMEPRSEDDALGHAHSAMMRRVATTIHDAESCVRRLMQEVDELRGASAALASAVDTDADRLRHTLSRVAAVAIQARTDADRGTALTERIVDSELLLDEGMGALDQAAGSLREVLGHAEIVQRLARHAGLLAVYAGADATQGATDIRGALPLEAEARALAHEAASVAAALTRMTIDGTEHVHALGVALDRVALSVRNGMSMTREVGTIARRRAAELLSADERLVELHAGMTRHASNARRLGARLELLSSHVRQQDAVLRRLDRGRSPLPVTALAPPAPPPPSRPELYRTPPHAHLVLPRLALA